MTQVVQPKPADPLLGTFKVKCFLLLLFASCISEAYMRRVFILRSGACSGCRLGQHEKHSSALV